MKKRGPLIVGGGMKYLFIKLFSLGLKLLIFISV
jgi:hypothetical protein